MRLSAQVNLATTTAQLAAISDLLRGDRNAMKPVLQSLGQIIAGWHVRNFQDKGKRFGGWPRINPAFALLRRRGSGPKVREWKDAVRLAYTANPLMDTGRLKISLQAGAAGNVLKVDRLAVTVGTNVKYAAKHQMGGGDFFVFGARERKIFDRNVAKTLPGKRASGSSAKKNWNPFYFQMLRYFERKRGQAFRVRKRPIIITSFDNRESRILQADLDRGLTAILARRPPR